MLNQLVVPISDEPITGFKRLAVHENFVVSPDLNMLQQVRVVLVNETGKALTQAIAENTALTAQQRRDALERYADKLITKTTEGAYLNPATMQIVEADAEGAVPQRDFFQLLTVGQVKALVEATDETPFSHLLYAMIANEIKNIDQRGDL